MMDSPASTIDMLDTHPPHMVDISVCYSHVGHSLHPHVDRSASTNDILDTWPSHIVASPASTVDMLDTCPTHMADSPDSTIDMHNTWPTHIVDSPASTVLYLEASACHLTINHPLTGLPSQSDLVY